MFLVIDSERCRRHDIRDALAKYFPDTFVLQAENGDVGIEFATRFHPEVVISALCVPGKTGIQIFQEIHGQFPEIKFILTPVLFARNQARGAGIKYFLSDLHPVKKLIEMIRKIKGEIGYPKELLPA